VLEYLVRHRDRGSGKEELPVGGVGRASLSKRTTSTRRYPRSVARSATRARRSNSWRQCRTRLSLVATAAGRPTAGSGAGRAARRAEPSHQVPGSCTGVRVCIWRRELACSYSWDSLCRASSAMVRRRRPPPKLPPADRTTNLRAAVSHSPKPRRGAAGAERDCLLRNRLAGIQTRL